MHAVQRETQTQSSSFPGHNTLCLDVESTWEALHVVGKRALVLEELDVGTVWLEVTLAALGNVLLTVERGEAPLLADDDLLATWELVLSAAKSLDGGWLVSITGSDGQDDLANVHTGDETIWLAESTTHSSLQSIGTSARQHLVDSDDVEWVGADAQVETFLTGDLDHVLVGADTGGFEGLGGELLILVGDKVDACWEVVDGRTLAAEIVDSDLCVGDTTVEP